MKTHRTLTTGAERRFVSSPYATDRHQRRLSFTLVLVACGLLTAIAPSRAGDRPESPRADADSVFATGPDEGTTLEDRVEIQWTTTASVAVTSTFEISRDGELIHVAASTEFIFEDWSAVPRVEYEYCVDIIEAGGSKTPIGCDMGSRVIARPTGFEASDGMFEDRVMLAWSDRSEIEGGFNIYRDAGNALNFDGDNEFVITEGIVDLDGSFTFEFWARRASTGTENFVINLEVNPNGDPVDVDLEIGFLANGQFAVGFGIDVLATTMTGAATGWHHWAVAYDAPDRRRIIYQNGIRIATDVLATNNQPTGDLEFGRRSKQGPTSRRGHFHGQIDEIRYWDIALTEEQVSSRMGALLSGAEPGLVGYWPMDVQTGLVAPDFFGEHSGSLINMEPSAWVTTGVPRFRTEIGADLTAYADETAVIGFKTYTYDVAAYEDVNGDGEFTPGTDFESEQRTDTGWRAFLTPPGNVSATDGQFNDRVRITWTDQSAAEDRYNIYRNGNLIAALLADNTQFDDLDATALQVYDYCVASSNGVESVLMCDSGMAGGLPAPTGVVATDGRYDDRILVSWMDPSDTEDGFEVYRGDSLVATLEENAEEFNDLGVKQLQPYDYCVRAFSKADPLNPAYSDTVCAPSSGVRAAILDPTDLVATQDDFEDRVELGWQNSSTTVMLYKVYRDNSLIEVLDFSFTAATDMEIPSDTDIEYCVSGGTVVSTASKALQGQVAQILQNFRLEDAVSKAVDGTVSSPEAKLIAAYEAMGLETVAKGESIFVDGFVESGRTCATGRRSLAPPAGVDATDNEFESHVQVTWEDSSRVESAYVVYRTAGGGMPTPLDTVSANRTTYGDFTGIPAVQYEYSVEALDSYGRSRLGTDLGERTLEPPTQFKATDGISETTIELTWKDNSAAEQGYRIYRKEVGQPDSVMIGETGKSEPAFTDTPPDSLLGVLLQYTVMAFDDFGISLDASDIGNTMLEAAANVNASDVYDSKIVVVWVDESGVESGYRLTRRKVGNRNVELTNSFAAGVTSFTDVGVTKDVEYIYCVEAFLNTIGGPKYADISCDIGALFVDPSGAGGVDSTLQSFRVSENTLTSNSDGAVRFGNSVAMDNSVALIGAPGADGTNRTGIANLYSFNDLNQWTFLQEFAPSAGDDFGHSVDLSGSYAAVGDPSFGAYSVWKNGAGWTEISSVSDGPNSGFSVAIVDSFIIVGDDAANSGDGGAVICNPEAASNCVGAPRLDELVTDSLSQALAKAEFGYAVDITRGLDDTLYAIVGAPGKDIESAFVFECGPGSAGQCTALTDWSWVGEITNPFNKAGGTEFGAAVSIDSSLAVVGAPRAGGFSLWERTGSQTWDERAIERPSVSEDGEFEEFGAAVAIRGTDILIGAPGEKVEEFQNAGAVYVYGWSDPELTESPIRYDAREGGEVRNQARFGTSADIGPKFYLVGAPGDADGGAAYSIPFGTEPSNDPIIPAEVDLVAPSEVSASDGTAPDRIQIRWSDEADDEDGHLVYRSKEDGIFERLAEVSANIEFYDDFEAAPGEAYTYCVSAFISASGEVEETWDNTGAGLRRVTLADSVCDIGWRPPNGTIAGIVNAAGGGGTADAEVCLTPSPNKALLLDGFRGHVRATAGDELDLTSNFTIEAWIRPHDVIGEHNIIGKDSAWALAVNGGDVQLTVMETNGLRTFQAGTSLSVGSWYHIAVTRSESNDVTFYLDGVFVDSIESNFLAEPGLSGLRIGHNDDCILAGPCVEPDTTGFFNGEIDEVRIWNTTRTVEQINSTRFEQLTGDEENLVSYWPLDEGKRRVVPDLTESTNHGHLIEGVYVTDVGAPIRTCAVTGTDGNFSVDRIRYGLATEFHVAVAHPTHDFEPSFRLITLTTESPVQNQVIFVDVTAFTVAGLVQYGDIINSDTLLCPVPEIGIHVSKDDVAIDENLRATTQADGSYSVAVDPSKDEGDVWHITPRFVDPNRSGIKHTYDPSSVELFVAGDTFNVDFFDELRHTLSGHFSGGDPDLCGKDIGVAEIRIWTEDGCYDRTLMVDSKVDNGAFSLDLPPLKYLVEVLNITGAPAAREEEITDFFEKLGAVEINLTLGDVVRNLIYRAPLLLSIEGLEPPLCPGDQIVQEDEEGNILRILPEVPKVGEFEFVPLTIRVLEDYGNGEFCPVDEGTVDIFDAIADRVDADSTMQLENGVAEYTTVGVSPNIFSGARIGGVDRSFQKPITVVAHVEGRPALTETQWVIVEGFRERSATFVSVITEEFPLLILYDPPGSNSYAFVETGVSHCTRISNTFQLGFSAGLTVDAKFGFGVRAIAGTPVAATIPVETGAGVIVGLTISGGVDATTLTPFLPNYSICVSASEAFSTSSDPTWVGEDIHVGVALNLIFAIADVLEFDDALCKIGLSETLAADLNDADPFETIYAYGVSHIELSLIPELEHLIELAGSDITLEGEIDGQETSIRLKQALENWKSQLKQSQALQEQALAGTSVNRSFSGGTDFTYAELSDTTRVTSFLNLRLWSALEAHAGATFELFDFETDIFAFFEIHSEFVLEVESTTGSSQTVGYVLSDGDTGDYFSVDIAKNSRYGTFVFGTRSGRSSNPWEENTQKRDNPIIHVDPPVLHNVDPDEWGNFELTLINASESDERRYYTMAVPGETNPKNLGITVTGDLLGGARLEAFLLEPGKALTINMDVAASPSAFSYENVAVVLYPENAFQNWLADVRQPFLLADTAFFSIFFDSTGGNTLAASMSEGWNWFSINRPGGEVQSVMKDFPTHHGDLIRSQNAETRYDSTSGWIGELMQLVPGEGYRIRVQQPGVFRIRGDAVTASEPMKLRPGWNWVGYLPSKRMPIEDALASLNERLIEGDAVIGQHGFAQYVNNVGWVGTLIDMEPGDSYELYLAGGGDLLYPEAPEESAPRLPTMRETTARGPEWEVVPGDYDASMIMVAEVRMNGRPLDHTAIKVAVTSDEIVRGLGDVRFVEELDQYLAFIMIYGALDEKADLRVHVYDGNSDNLFEEVGTVHYASQTMLGQAASPVHLELNNAGLAPELLDLPEVFALYPNYPNPFNPITIIGYDLPEQANVSIIIYDIMGRQIAKLVDSEQAAGRHKVVVDGRSYASGLYLYRMDAGDFTQVGKMMLVK